MSVEEVKQRLKSERIVSISAEEWTELRRLTDDDEVGQSDSLIEFEVDHGIGNSGPSE